MAMGQRRKTAAEIWPHRQGHPLDIFQRGRNGVNHIGDTMEVFEKARALLWAAPDLLAALKVLSYRVGADLNQGVHGDDPKEGSYKIVEAEYDQARAAILRATGAR